MQRTKIEYLTHTWNPIAMRCSPVSEGCKNCWHLAMVKRLSKNPMLSKAERFAYTAIEDGFCGPPILREEELEAPLHLRKPSRIGVQLMGDLFHESISDGFLFSIFGVMASEEVGHHSFFVLTKRPKRMADWLNQYVTFKIDPSKLFERVWLGVSVEDQKTADERIPILLQIPAAHRWVSVEPMLGPVKIPEKALCPCSCFAGNPRNPHPDCADKPSIDWVVCGGETGSKARPMHPDWVRSVRDQCQSAGVPFFFKGWGEWTETDCIPGGDLGGDMRRGLVEIVHAEGNPEGFFRRGDVFMRKVGHKNSGHLLDGKEWREIPR